MDEPTWVPPIAVIMAHTRQLLEHGGLQGTRDPNGLESALARPQNKWQYDPTVDLASLAAAYAYGLATAHPFADGNKRTAYVTARIFLDLNGYDLERSPREIVDTMLAVATRALSEDDLAAWIRSALVPLPPAADAEPEPAGDTED